MGGWKTIMFASSMFAFSATAMAEGGIVWNRLCSPGAFIVAGVDCDSGCDLKKQVGQTATIVGQYGEGINVIEALVDDGVSTWVVEKNGTAVTQTLQIDSSACPQ